MQNDRLDRAKQFMPFDALKGFREAIREKEKIIENKNIIDEDNSNNINNILNKLKVGLRVEITYYYEYHYITKTIDIKKLSFQSGKIILNNNIINFDDLKDIKIIG